VFSALFSGRVVLPTQTQKRQVDSNKKNPEIKRAEKGPKKLSRSRARSTEQKNRRKTAFAKKKPNALYRQKYDRKFKLKTDGKRIIIKRLRIQLKDFDFCHAVEWCHKIHAASKQFTDGVWTRARKIYSEEDKMTKANAL